MKINDLEVSVKAVVAIGTAFLGLSGYLSVRAQANVLGIGRGTLYSNWRYVLEAAELAVALLFLLLVISAAVSLVFTIAVLARHLLPDQVRTLETKIERLARSHVFIIFFVSGTLVTAFCCIWVLSNGPHDIAVGVLMPMPIQDARVGGIFLLSVIVLCAWGTLALAYGRTGHGWLRNKWVWSLSIPSLAILAVTLPIAYGSGIRDESFTSVRLVSENSEDTSCGLLVERDDKRLAYWTAVRAGRDVVGVVREVSLETTTLELGPVVNIRKQIWNLIVSDRNGGLCKAFAELESANRGG